MSNVLRGLIDDYLDMLSLQGRSHNTLRAYAHSLRYMERFFAEHHPRRLDDPESIRPRELVAWYASRRESGLAPTSVGKLHTDARAFFNWCVREEEWSRNPISRVKAPRVEAEPVSLVDPETTRALLALEWKSPFFTARNRAIILVLLDSGVRVSELTGMQVDDLDMSQGRVTVTGKGGRVRVVPLGRSSRVALRRYLRRRERFPHGHFSALWVGMQGPIKSVAVNKILEIACERAGVPHVKPHAFRHTFGHSALRAGAREGDVMYIGGWRTREMLDRYGAAGRAQRALEAHADFSPGDAL